MKIRNFNQGTHILANEDKRHSNFIIDFALSSLLGVLLSLPIHYFFKSWFISILTYYIVRFFYYFYSEYKYNKTPAKFHTQTKVIVLDSSSLSLKSLFIRNTTRFISLISAISDDNFAVHDSLSNTLVVEDMEAQKVNMKYYYRISLFLLIFIFLKLFFSK